MRHPTKVARLRANASLASFARALRDEARFYGREYREAYAEKKAAEWGSKAYEAADRECWLISEAQTQAIARAEHASRLAGVDLDAGWYNREES